MTSVQPKNKPLIKNNNLSSLKTMGDKNIDPKIKPLPLSPEISSAAKNLNSNPETNNQSLTEDKAKDSATTIAKTLSKVPILPIALPSDIKKTSALASEEKLPSPAKSNFIKKPAVIFIEGLNFLGLADDLGIKEMAQNMPNAKIFSWNEEDKIIDEIKKHAPDQPVILVGKGYGGDSAVKVANTLNSIKNGFREIELLVSMDSIGMNNSIIPMNVKKNLNFIGTSSLPFLQGKPDIAKNPEYTKVINELRPETHSLLDQSEEIQFKIFESINDILKLQSNKDLFFEIQKNEHLKKVIDSRPDLKP